VPISLLEAVACIERMNAPAVAWDEPTGRPGVIGRILENPMSKNLATFAKGVQLFKSMDIVQGAKVSFTRVAAGLPISRRELATNGAKHVLEDGSIVMPAFRCEHLDVHLAHVSMPDGSVVSDKVVLTWHVLKSTVELIQVSVTAAKQASAGKAGHCYSQFMLLGAIFLPRGLASHLWTTFGTELAAAAGIKATERNGAAGGDSAAHTRATAYSWADSEAWMDDAALVAAADAAVAAAAAAAAAPPIAAPHFAGADPAQDSDSAGDTSTSTIDPNWVVANKSATACTAASHPWPATTAAAPPGR